MTTDKLFVLLLVILLPLTGCLDIADNAEAEESDDSEIEDGGIQVFSLFVAEGTNTTLTFDGTETLYLESIYRGATGSNRGGHQTNFVNFDMTCNGTIMVEDAYISDDEYLPVLAGQICTVNFDSTFTDYYFFFEKASLSAL